MTSESKTTTMAPHRCRRILPSSSRCHRRSRIPSHRLVVILRCPTTGKCHSFIRVFKSVDTDEHIQIIFVGPETDAYVSFGLSLTGSIYSLVRLHHRRIYRTTYIHWLTDEYRRDLEMTHFLFLPSPHAHFLSFIETRSRHLLSARATASSLLTPLPPSLCRRCTARPLAHCRGL
jgi:hypothetical protein